MLSHALCYCSVLNMLKRMSNKISKNYDSKRNNFLRKIFGANLYKSLKDCEKLQEFDKNVSAFYDEFSMVKELKKFASYIKKRRRILPGTHNKANCKWVRSK